MENFLSEEEKRNLVQELSQGRELAKQLHIHLLQSSSHEAGKVLLNEILSSFEQALSLVHHGRPGDETGGGAVAAVSVSVVPDPPQSLTRSPPTVVSDQSNRKRRWTRKVEMRGDQTAIEGQLDDGYGWRKYGQKDILGAKYPRGYYRCTQRYGQGCLATKQIQRSDGDPNTLDITYSGIHTCDPEGNPSPSDQFSHQSQQPFFNAQTSL